MAMRKYEKNLTKGIFQVSLKMGNFRHITHTIGEKFNLLSIRCNSNLVDGSMWAIKNLLCRIPMYGYLVCAFILFGMYSIILTLIGQPYYLAYRVKP